MLRALHIANWRLPLVMGWEQNLLPRKPFSEMPALLRRDALKTMTGKPARKIIFALKHFLSLAFYSAHAVV